MILRSGFLGDGGAIKGETTATAGFATTVGGSVLADSNVSVLSVPWVGRDTMALRFYSFVTNPGFEWVIL